MTGLATGRSGITVAAFALLAIEARVAAYTITGCPFVRALALTGEGVGYHRVGAAYRTLALAGLGVSYFRRIAAYRTLALAGLGV